MKLLATLSVAIAVAVVTPALAGPTLDRIKAAGELVNVVDNSYPPHRILQFVRDPDRAQG